jgi:hypothetical protein
LHYHKSFYGVQDYLNYQMIGGDFQRDGAERPSLRFGEVLTMTLDVDARTLSFISDVSHWNVTISGLPANTQFVPHIALAFTGDSVTVLDKEAVSASAVAEQPKQQVVCVLCCVLLGGWFAAGCAALLSRVRCRLVFRCAPRLCLVAVLRAAVCGVIAGSSSSVVCECD